MSDKIINTFQQRRELQNRMAELQETQNEAEMLEIVRALAHEFPADMIHKVMLKALDTTNSQLRGGLAHLATLLPPEETIDVLRKAVADRGRSTQSRLNSVTVLERFLGQEVSPALLGDLENTDEIAFQSLCEAIEEGHKERHIFLEYVIQMREEDAEVAYIVMKQLRRLPATDQLDMLRLMAQDDRAAVATAALKRLEAMDAEEAGERLAAILYSLQFTLPPELATEAERAARKLRFNGQGYDVPEPESWRALISPAEATGNQTIWFFRSTDENAADGSAADGDKNETPFLSIVINLSTGILQTYGADRMPLEDLPELHDVGQLMTVSLDGGESIVFVESPFDYARWLVLSSLAPHWNEQAWQPLFGEYTLYNDMLWQFAAPQLPDSLQDIFAINEADSGEEADGMDKGKTQSEDDIARELEQLDDMAMELLKHPSMGGWIRHSRLFWSAIRAGFQKGEVDFADELTQTVLHEVKQWPEQEVFIQGLLNGLKCQTAWLEIAGMEKAAGQALQIAKSFETKPVDQNPFLYRYLRQAIAGG